MVFIFLMAELTVAITVFAGEIRIAAWNIESGGNEPAVIADQLESFAEYDIVALVECDDNETERYRRALGNRHRMTLSQTGSRFNDHIAVFFDPAVLELIDYRELHGHGGITLIEKPRTTGLRSPQILRFRHIATGEELVLVAVHLARSNGAQRTLESFVLREWILDDGGPVVAAGDFNFDYDFAGSSEDHRGNEAFRLFTYQDEITWVRPRRLADTNYSERDGRETYPDSVLDFVFVSGVPDPWRVASEIIVRPGDFPDDATTSDHRPITATIGFP